jgi:hypothetical protein
MKVVWMDESWVENSVDMTVVPLVAWLVAKMEFEWARRMVEQWVD